MQLFRVGWPENGYCNRVVEHEGAELVAGVCLVGAQQPGEHSVDRAGERGGGQVSERLDGEEGLVGRSDRGRDVDL